MLQKDRLHLMALIDLEKRLEYELNKTTVYLNGIKLKESTDWTA